MLIRWPQAHSASPPSRVLVSKAILAMHNPSKVKNGLLSSGRREPASLCIEKGWENEENLCGGILELSALLPNRFFFLLNADG